MPKARKKKHDRFVFRRLDSVGAADAEEDAAFLKDCFVDNGFLEALRDCSNPRRIVLGRTGSGKTALLQKLVELEEHVIEVSPDSLAIGYISNSNILSFVSALGVKLDIFFKLLWRHVFTIELIRAHFNLTSASEGKTFLEKIQSIFRSRRDQRAIEYLHKWGKSFWEETDYRIKEVTTKLEEELRGSLGAEIKVAKLGAEGTQKLTQEEKGELTARAQSVVNSVQIRELSDVIKLLDHVLDDPHKLYYITIDRLDEDWVEDKLRYRLLRALIETVREFRSVRHAKIIIALRVDLLERVFRLTRDAGFQEEKYEALYLNVDWTDDQLSDLLDRRVQHLVQMRYTKQPVKMFDLLPDRLGPNGAIGYMIDRTMMRPRDLISFFNECIEQAVGRYALTKTAVLDAEGKYSRNRIRALADEWHSDYPNLLCFIELLKNRPKLFRLSDFTDLDVQNFALNVVIAQPQDNDDLSAAANQLVNEMTTPSEFRRVIVQIFYKIGLVGLKLHASEEVNWSLDGRKGISSAEIEDSLRVAIHPFAFRTLGIRGTGI